MTKISIIGLGTMARTLGVRATAAGHNVQVVGRDAARAAELAADLGGAATASTVGDTPTGDIVILAVPYASAASIVSDYGPALAGKVVVDISNPFDSAHTGLVTLRDSSPPRRSPQRPPRVRRSSRRSTPCSPGSWRQVRQPAIPLTCSSPVTTPMRRRRSPHSSRASGCARWTPAT
ncbi:hypothetical protein GCM10023320_42900 [Pseudonocardia adelaidensis]|uniref:Pyrroline-5-carboxylate reductase catalytic N-terminal domain-containing protein n=2 Tax=Pseudonocardia adelaidensis TaxID=648754 RepID=A0ABP9NLZ4_9PSEU